MQGTTWLPNVTYRFSSIINVRYTDDVCTCVITACNTLNIERNEVYKLHQAIEKYFVTFFYFLLSFDVDDCKCLIIYRVMAFKMAKWIVGFLFSSYKHCQNLITNDQESSKVTFLTTKVFILPRNASQCVLWVLKFVGVPQPKPLHGFSQNFQGMFTPRGSRAD